MFKIRHFQSFIILLFIISSNLGFAQKQRLVLPEGHSGYETKFDYQPIKFIFSKDSKLIATSESFYLKIWDVRSGKLLNTIFTHSNGTTSICFSANNKQIITSGYDREMNSDSLITTIKSWDINTGKGKILVSFPKMHFFIDIQLTLDYTKIICTTDSQIIIYNINENKIEKKISVNDAYGTFLLKKEGKEKYITFGSFIKIWDLDGNEMNSRNKFSRISKNPENQFSNNSFITRRNDSIIIYNLDFTVKQSYYLGRFIENAEITKDDHYLFVNIYPDKLYILDLKTKKISFSETNVEHFTVNSSSNYFVIKQKEKTPIIRQTKKPDKIIDIYNSSNSTLYNSFSSHSKDQNKLIICYKTTMSNLFIDIIDAQKLLKISTLEGHALGIEYATFNKSGKKVFTSTNGSHNQVFDMQTGKLIGKFILKSEEEMNEIATYDTIINGKQVIFEYGMGGSSTTMGASIIDKNQNIICTFYPIDNEDYLTLLPSGYYQSSNAAAKLLHYVTKDLKVITFEQLDVKYNRPDKVLEALGSTDTLLIESYRKAYEKRIKKLGIDTSAFRDDISVPEADFANRDQIEFEQKNETLKLNIKANDSLNKLDRYNVWVNEVPIYGQRGISIKNLNLNELDTTLTLKLSEGENSIETSITNINGVESYRMPLHVKYSPKHSTQEKIYFIGIGIDKFTDNSHNLKFCVKDIQDLAEKLNEKYGSDIIIDTLFNENVTLNNIKNLKKKLFTSNINDKVIISYSGHGLLSKDFDYFLSTHSVNFNDPSIDGLPYDELENLLDSIPARKKLMLIDACHSGEVDKDDLVKINTDSNSALIKGSIPVAYKQNEKHLGLKNSFELMQSIFVNVGKSTGATIISASAGTQFALEKNDSKNGVFTYSILEALQQHDTLKVSELKSIVSKRVEELTNGLQKPTSRNETISVDWNIW